MAVPRDQTTLLTAPTPAVWLGTHLAAHQARYDELHETDPAGHGAAWLSLSELLAPGSLSTAHARLVGDGEASVPGGVKVLAGWFPGSAAGLVGFTLATAGAGLLLDPATLRWRVAAGGWPDRVDLGSPDVVVPAGHPWSGQPGVQTVPDDATVAARAVAALTTVLDPVVDALRRLARVGRTALWTEIGDGFGLPVLHHPTLPVSADAVARLRAALGAPGAPWRKVPQLRVGRAEHGPVYLGRKAGCCLAHQTQPPVDGRPDGCSTCSLRDLADCEDRQRRWHVEHRTDRGWAVPGLPAGVVS